MQVPRCSTLLLRPFLLQGLLLISDKWCVSGFSAGNRAPPAVRSCSKTGNSKNKVRKQTARRKAEQGINRKLQADADFFWQCVSKRDRGIDIAGVSGKKWHRPSRAELFGEVRKDDSSRGKLNATITTTTDEGKVTRSGGAMEIPVMDNDFGGNAEYDALPGFVLQNLLGADRMRYTAPSPIQKHCVPLGLVGCDILASAQTGSGKTVGFLLPLIASVAKNRQSESKVDKTTHTGHSKQKKTPSSPAALILAPTRELALQIDLEIDKLTFGAPPPIPSSASKATAARWSACCYGGATARPQLEALASGVEILVATPGRLADFLDRDLVSLSNCKFLVLDEADRMLDMGFEPQLRKIVEQSDMPARTDGRQTLLFSATFPKALRVIAEKSYLRPNFARVAVGKVGASNKSVEQRIVKIEGDGTKRDKLNVLIEILREQGGNIKQQKPTIVFTNKKHVANWIAKQLTQKSVRCSQIHGDRTQGQRESALQKFRDRKVDVLVATDAVSRGIDIDNVAHVIQFDMPFGVKEFESYTHRIGRTGRAGKTGIATAFYVPGYQAKVGNAELWSLIKGSFDESGMELPEWFYQENQNQGNNNGVRQGRQGAPPKRRPHSRSTSTAPMYDQSRGRTVRSQSLINASGLKNKPRSRDRGRESSNVTPSVNKADEELKSILDEFLAKK